MHASPAGAPATAGSAAPSSSPPAAQLGHALAALHSTPDGAKHVTVRLSPAELGQVQIRVSRAADGGASVSVSVERAETLRSLQADLPQLHQTLDRAGVPEQRSLSLHLATPESAAGGGQTGWQADPRQQQPHHQPQGQTRSQMPSASHPDFGDDADFEPELPLSSRWLRAGVNITA